MREGEEAGTAGDLVDAAQRGGGQAAVGLAVGLARLAAPTDLALRLDRATRPRPTPVGAQVMARRASSHRHHHNASRSAGTSGRQVRISLLIHPYVGQQVEITGSRGARYARARLPSGATAHILACLRIAVVVAHSVARLATDLPALALVGRDSHPLDEYSEFQDVTDDIPPSGPALPGRFHPPPVLYEI